MNTDTVHLYSICMETLSEDQNCVIIQECNHIFHRICIETSLVNSSQCPVCKRSCQLSELRGYNFNVSTNNNTVFDSPHIEGSVPLINTTKPSGRGKPRGAKAYNTRSHMRNLFNDCKQPLNTTQELVHQENGANQNEPISSRNNKAQNTKGGRVNVDYDYINRMIEESMSRLLSAINIDLSGGISSKTTAPINIPRTPTENRSAHDYPMSHMHNHNQRATDHSAVEQNVSHPLNLSSQFRMPYTVDKISSIIQGWNLRFEVSPTGLNVEEFLYRVRSLTKDYFDGDLSIICKNLQILLSGRARDWLWRYRKQVQNIEWENFCQAIRSQYADFKTSSDLRGKYETVSRSRERYLIFFGFNFWHNRSARYTDV